MKIEPLILRKSSDCRFTSLDVSISAFLPPIEAHTLEEFGRILQADAERLADALVQSLPQGTVHRLIIELMSRHVSYYRGSMQPREGT